MRHSAVSVAGNRPVSPKIPLRSLASPNLVWGLYCQALRAASFMLSRSVSLFDLESVSSLSTHSIAKRARAGAVKVGRRTNLSTRSAFARPYLDGSAHGGTLDAVGMTIRGEPACGRVSIAPQPCIRWSKDPNHDAVMRIGGEAPRRRTHSFPRQKSHGLEAGTPPPRTVIGDPS
jgi:hypothetical protein